MNLNQHQEPVRHRKWQKELKRKKVRKFTKKLTLATRIYNKTAGKVLKQPANFLADYKRDKETLTPEALKGKYGDILNNVIETNKIIRKGVNLNMDNQAPNDPSHAVPGIDVNNPPAKKVRLDAEVVGDNPIEGIKTPSANLEVNQPAPTRDADTQNEELPSDEPVKNEEAPEAPETPSEEPELPEVEEELEPEVEDEVPSAPVETPDTNPSNEKPEVTPAEEPESPEVEAPAENPEASKPEEEAPKTEETTSAQ